MKESILILYLSLSAVISMLLIFRKSLHRKNRSLKLPPSPKGLPVIGHLHLIKEPVHRTLQKISQKYGDVVYLNFGTRPVVIISSPSAVKECFTENDIILANRPQLMMGKHLGYNYNTMLTAPYGDHWRNLRKISSLELFSPSRLTLSASIRRDEVAKMVKKLCDSSSQGGYVKVELKTVLNQLNFYIILRMLAGKRCYAKSENFTEIIQEAIEFAGAAHPGDYVTFLRWIDYGGCVKRCKKFAKKADHFIQGLIDEHRREINRRKGEETMIDRLLCLQKSEPEYYTDETIKGHILVLLMAGTETSAIALEWAMSLLLNHPNDMNKAKLELETQVGEDHLLDESDLSKLEFLHNIISETLRIFPPTPVLLPHMSSQECRVGGFDIPRGTMLIVNAWAIQRDPSLWNEPLEFKPDRFAKTGPDQFCFLPFGLGRRSCPGATLANGLIGLALGSLIQCLDWRRVSDEEVNMTEGKGLTLPKALPLEAMCKARPNMRKFL